MKITFRFFAILALCLVIHSVDAQRILLVEKPGKFKNYKYFVGDDIILKTFPNNQKHEGIIHEITDTSILINFSNEIMLKDINKVLRKRAGLPWLSLIVRTIGVGYFMLDVVNNTINNEPMVDQQTLMISGGLVAFSYAIVPLHNRHLKRGEKWRIKVLNMSMDEEVPNPYQR